MKKISAFSLIIILVACVFSGCEKDIYFDGKYDTEKFALCSDLSDVKFLIPKEYNDLKQPLKDIEAEIQNIETEEEKLDFIKSRVVFQSDGVDYLISKHTDFYLYVLDLDGVRGIERIEDATKLAKIFGVDSFLKIENNDTSKNTCKTKKGRTRCTFSTIITETDIGNKYVGYVSIIEDPETNKVYAILVGYGDDKHDVTSKAIADNFYLTK